jgi:hypothetical protein
MASCPGHETDLKIKRRPVVSADHRPSHIDCAMTLQQVPRFSWKIAFPLFLCGMSAAVSAAPLDTMMTADMPGGPSQRYMIEASGDFLNRAFDPFDLASSRSGKYTGGHLSLALRLSSDWWVSGSYWRRDINYGGDTNNINSWQVSVNRILGHLGPGSTTVAARFSLWGDWAGSLDRSNPATVFGRTVSQVHVDSPTDIQAQFDLVASGHLNAENGFNVFAGVGGSRVSAKSLNANATSGGCQYHVNVNDDNQATATLLAPCQIGGSTVTNFTVSGNAATLGYDFERGFIYHAAFMTAGASWDWNDGPFGAVVGYRFQYLWRGGVDSQLNAFGLQPIRSQHDVLAQVSYAVTKNVSLFLRGQLYAHGEIGDLPLTYNAAMSPALVN